MKACVYTPGMPHFVICAISQLPNHGSSANRIGSRFGFCGGPPVYVYSSGCASCRSCMIGGYAVKYHSMIARICTSLMLMSRLLSWYTYLPQYGTPAPPPKPPPPPPPPARGAATGARRVVSPATAGAGVTTGVIAGAGIAAAMSSPRKNQSTLRSRPSASAAGVIDTYSCSRI